MMESITTVLQKIHSKTNYISVTIPFKFESKANSTELSKHFWKIKRNGIEKPIMLWSVIDHSKPYQNESKRYKLCLREKCHILTSLVNLIN